MDNNAPRIWENKIESLMLSHLFEREFKTDFFAMPFMNFPYNILNAKESQSNREQLFQFSLSKNA